VQAREEIFAFESAKKPVTERQHEYGSESNPNREKNEYGGMIQLVFDDYKWRAPQQGTEG